MFDKDTCFHTWAATGSDPNHRLISYSLVRNISVISRSLRVTLSKSHRSASCCAGSRKIYCNCQLCRLVSSPAYPVRLQEVPSASSMQDCYRLCRATCMPGARYADIICIQKLVALARRGVSSHHSNWSGHRSCQSGCPLQVWGGGSGLAMTKKPFDFTTIGMLLTLLNHCSQSEVLSQTWQQRLIPK